MWNLARYGRQFAAAMSAALLIPTCGLASSPSVAPEQLVREAVQNEIRASQSAAVNHMFRSRRQTAHGSQTRLYCETRDAMVGMTIANDDKPLSPDQRQAEEARLTNLIRHPDELKKKRQQEKENADRVIRIVRAMPDAFLFDYDGSETGHPGLGRSGEELVRLKFHPNPHFDPPSRVEQVLQGMQGVLLIDPDQRRIARIDGTLVKDVGFGWGILGHLDKGGHFLVEQEDLGDGTWDASRMTLTFTGKILLFKRLDMHSDEVNTGYRRVPSNLTFAEGVDLVRKEVSQGQVGSSPAATGSAQRVAGAAVRPDP